MTDVMATVEGLAAELCTHCLAKCNFLDDSRERIFMLLSYKFYFTCFLYIYSNVAFCMYGAIL